MSYIAPVHHATSIRHALRICFLSPEHEDLVVAKGNRLEIWRLTSEGMVCLHTKIFYGTISMLQRLRPKDTPTDLLFIGTDRFRYFNAAWDPETNEIKTVEDPMRDDAEEFMRDSQSQNKCLVDPTGRFMVIHLWEGVMNVFRLPLRKGSTTKLESLDQVRLTELYIKDSTFLYSRTGHPLIAFLYKSQPDNEEARLAIYRLTKDDKGGEVSKFNPRTDRENMRVNMESGVVIDDPFASMLIPIPIHEEKRYHVRNVEGAKAHLGGLLVVGDTLLTYFDSLTYTSVKAQLPGPKIYVAWAECDGTHFILADDYGRLDLLTIEVSADPSGVVVTGMTVQPFQNANGESLTSRASSLVYMGDNCLFLASHHGDSQLLRLDVEACAMSAIYKMSNNAPIMDFAIMDMGNREGDSQFGNAFSSGQARIVAGCGAYRDGSLRSIRSGVNLDVQGVLDDLGKIRAVFPLRSQGSSSIDTLALSSIPETRFLKFGPEGDIEEVASFPGMITNTETLLAKSLSHERTLQVTATSVLLLDTASSVTVSRYDIPEGSTITAVSANSKRVFLSVNGSSLVSLDMDDNLQATWQDTAQGPSEGISDQISCLHASPSLENIGVTGWWTSGSISIVDLETLAPIHGENLRNTAGSASVPRDIALAQLHPPHIAGPTLLIAMEDGNVVTFNVQVEPFSLSGRKTVTLGVNPAKLHLLPQEEVYTIFATTEHASLIYSAEGRIIYSATPAEDVTFVSPLNADAFPNSIVVVSDSLVRICTVDRERLTHVKTLPMVETVRRVAYSPGLKAFGLGCIKKELKRSGDVVDEVITSSVKLVDEVIFEELGRSFVLDNSSTTEMVETVIRAELTDSGGNTAERFIVGTSFISGDDDAQTDGHHGRILVLGVDENRQIYQITSHPLKGICRCLAVMGDHIVAGLSKTVVVYSYLEDTSSHGHLEKLASYRPAAYVVDMDVTGNMIGLVDLMQSLTLLEFIPSEGGSKPRLEERARHYENLWSTAVCHLDNERWLETDAQCNVLVLKRNVEAPEELDRRRLEVTSEMNLGEQVNKIRKLQVEPSDSLVVSPRAFLGTTEGSLYLFGDISPDYQDLLMTLQTKLQDYIHVPGGVTFDEWRALRTRARKGELPYRFVDGEMVERFLDLDESQQESVCEGLGHSVEDMRNMLEELRRMH